MLDIPFTAINILSFNYVLLIKIFLLLILAIYAIFSFFVYTKIRAMNRIVYFPERSASDSLQTAALFYFFVIISLFILTLVIV